jgi:hypothetical protein
VAAECALRSRQRWVSQVGLPHLLDQNSPAREHLHQPGDGRVQQRVQFVVAGRTGFDEQRHASALHRYSMIHA